MNNAERDLTAITLRNVALSFVDVPQPKPRRWRAFIRTARPEMALDDDHHEIMIWWMTEGHDLAERLRRIGLEPPPTHEELLREAANIGQPVTMKSSVELLQQATGILPAALSTLLGAWLQARFGRKIRLKIGDTEAEATSVVEVEQLLEKARALRAMQGTGS